MTRIVSSDDELHVGIPLPRHTARNIFQWAKDQNWPEGSKLQEPKDLHITLLYSPTGYELKDSWWINHLDKAVVNIVGFDNFPATEQEGFAYVLLIDSPDILMKADELQSRAKEFGLPITDFPGGYKPHITVAYGSVKATGIKAPYFEFDVGPSEVSPRRIASRVAYNPEEVQVLDRLSLANIAHNLHYKFEQDPNTDIVTFSKKLLNLIGYPQDDITAQAALQSWQQMYPQDKTLPKGQEKFGHVPNGLCYPLGNTHTEPKSIKVKQPDELEGWDEKSTVPSEVNNPEDRIPEFGDPQPDKKDVQFSNDWNYKDSKKSPSKTG